MTDASAIVAMARELAAAHPQAMLPCPECGASVRGHNLDAHLSRVHPTTPQGAPDPAGSVTLTGVDRWIVRPAIALVAACAVGVIAAMKPGAPVDHARMAIIGGPFLAAFAVMAMALAGVFKARLRLGAGALEVRVGWGLVSRSLRLPVELEVGALIERKDAGVTNLTDNTSTEDKRAGWYLRMWRGGGSITVGAQSSAGLGAHWALEGWRTARKRRGCHILLGREAMIALEYFLATRGMLRPKA